MPSQGSYSDALLRVIDEVVAPGAATVDASGEFPREQVSTLGAAGLLALTVPAEFGGGGAGLREAADVIRELGSVCGSTAMVITMHYSAVAALTAAGDKETLTAVAAGTHLSTLAFSETGSPLTSASPTTRPRSSPPCTPATSCKRLTLTTRSQEQGLSERVRRPLSPTRLWRAVGAGRVDRPS